MRRFVSLSMFLFPAVAHAIVAATPEQVLCSSSDIVKAKVVSAAVPDCTPDFTEYDQCSQGPLVPLSIQVIKVIAQQHNDPKGKVPIEGLAEGSLVNIITNSINRIPTPIGGMQGAPLESSGSMTIRPPTGKPLTQEQVQEAFTGKEFIFAISHRKWDPVDKPIYSSIWPAEREPWVYEAIEKEKKNAIAYKYKSSCPQLVE